MRVGDRCFIKGALGEIVGCMGSQRAVVMITEVHSTDTPVKGQVLELFSNSSTTYAMPWEIVEPICTTVFKVGQTVKAVYAGNQGFEGVVTGFELSTNRVLCQSSKNKNSDRTRFAYKIDELSVYVEQVEFIINHKYQDRTGKVYRTVGIDCFNKLGLIEDNTGKYLITVREVETEKVLSDCGLYGLKDTSRSHRC